MLITRNIGGLVRGKATPFQLAAGCILGALLGFIPGFSTAPGLTVLLSFTLLLLNANLFLAAAIGTVAKVISWVALPLSFALGRLLLDGPSAGAFELMVNAPGLALLGVENYVTTGGMVLGLGFGTLCAWGVVSNVTRLRQKLADAGRHSQRFQHWNNRPWVRCSVFLLAGGGLKDPDYAALAAKKVGNPIRPLGVAFVAVSVAFIVIAAKFFAPLIVTTALHQGLERANGATVDLQAADLDLRSGRLTLTGLAIADPQNLDTNLLAAEHVEADVSGLDLLRKRLKIDNLVIVGGRLSAPRELPGQLVGPSPAIEKGPLPAPGDMRTLEDYVQNAQLWRERLAQLKGWLDRLNGDEAAPGASGQGDAPPESWTDRVQRIAEERGYAEVNADHLVSESPTLRITHLLADQVTAPWLPDETLTIRGQHLSTHPRLHPEIPTLAISSSHHTLGLKVAAGSTTTVAAHYRGLPAAKVGQILRQAPDSAILEEGTIDLAFDGSYSSRNGTIDWPLEITLRHTRLNVAGRSTPLEKFTLPVGLAGSLQSPRINVETNALARLAQQAGIEILQEKAQNALSEPAGGLIKGLFGGK